MEEPTASNLKIRRYSEKDRTIKRSAAPENFRIESEVQAAYAQVGQPPGRDTKSWYRDIYEFYQKNEV